MITRLHTALALCLCVTGCVYSNARPTPPPPAARPPAPPVTSQKPSGSGSSGHAQHDASKEPKEKQGPERAAGSAADTTNPKRKVGHLEVPLQAKSKSQLVGKVQLTDLPNGVKVVVHVDHIEPGLHGVFIHEFADCSGKDAASAGPHFDPDDNPHALPSEKQRHLGDLGNLVAQAPDGKGRLEVVVPHANLTVGAPRSFLNRSLVVHADYDDGTKQPGGHAGKRIGCAELTIAAAKAQPEGKVVWSK